MEHEINDDFEEDEETTSSDEEKKVEKDEEDERELVTQACLWGFAARYLDENEIDDKNLRDGVYKSFSGEKKVSGKEDQVVGNYFYTIDFKFVEVLFNYILDINRGVISEQSRNANYDELIRTHRIVAGISGSSNVCYLSGRIGLSRQAIKQDVRIPINDHNFKKLITYIHHLPQNKYKCGAVSFVIKYVRMSYYIYPQLSTKIKEFYDQCDVCAKAALIKNQKTEEVPLIPLGPFNINKKKTNKKDIPSPKSSPISSPILLPQIPQIPIIRTDEDEQNNSSSSNNYNKRKFEFIYYDVEDVVNKKYHKPSEPTTMSATTTPTTTPTTTTTTAIPTSRTTTLITTTEVTKTTPTTSPSRAPTQTITITSTIPSVDNISVNRVEQVDFGMKFINLSCAPHSLPIKISDMSTKVILPTVSEAFYIDNHKSLCDQIDFIDPEQITPVVEFGEYIMVFVSSGVGDMFVIGCLKNDVYYSMPDVAKVTVKKVSSKKTKENIEAYMNKPMGELVSFTLKKS